MRNRSLIDDVDVPDVEGPSGIPIRFANQEIRKMLRLAKADESDVFYDLGSGWGQTLIVALTEFGVKKAVGFEKIRARRSRSEERLRHWSARRKDITRDRWQVVHCNFDLLLKGLLPNAPLQEATIIFYGLTTDSRILQGIEKGGENCRGKRRLLYYHNCLFPEILPDEVDFPFYVARFPFRHTTSKIEWLRSVLNKRISSIKRGKLSDEKELWDELSHDADVLADREELEYYRQKLEEIARNIRKKDRDSRNKHTL